jgi:adenine-specific DNA-methyltransferase
MEHLFHAGDNLDGLAQLAGAGVKVDLVYIDPPFATNNEFLIDSDRANTISASGSLAYADTVRGDDYLEQLRLRLEAIRQVLADDGSIYVHIDVKMEHRLRLLLDDVFGARNFRNSITRIKCNPKNFTRYSYGNVKDTILFYSVAPHHIKWHPQEEPLTDDDAASRYPLVDDEGRRYATTPLHAPGTTRNGPTGGAWRGMPPPLGRHWRYHPDKLDELDAAGLIAWSGTGNPRKIIYADQSSGKLPQDVWVYKDPQRPSYPTQKNAAMLERIILTSSEPGDTVLDCYAGSGSTLLEAERLGRRFIGMDDSPAAQGVIERRLQERQIKMRSIADSGPHHSDKHTLEDGEDSGTLIAPSIKNPSTD